MNRVSRTMQIAKGLYRTNQAMGGTDFDAAGKQITKICTELGPTFIKLGQIMSLRPDIIPEQIANDLRALLDQGAPINEDVSEIFRKEFGRSPDEIFDFFEPKPFAVASLAQVHKAKYKGQLLAIKIQKPNIEQVIRQDVAIAKGMLSLASLVPSIRKSKPLIETVISEFFTWLEHELDYRLEALHMAQIGNNFKSVKYFVVPKIVPELSTKRILSMQYIDGITLNEIYDNVENLPLRKTIAYKNIRFQKAAFIKRISSIIFKEFFVDGYFHGDPHPANILLTSDGNIALIDFGIVGVLTPRLREQLFNIFYAIVDRDVDKIATGLVSLDEIQGHAEISELEKRIRDFLNGWQSGTVIEMSTAEVFYRLITIARQCQIDLPLPLVIFGKTLLEYDGNVHKLEPTLDVVETFRPYVEDMYRKGMLPSSVSPVPTNVSDLIGQIDKLPAELGAIVKHLANDGVEFTVHIGAPTSNEPEIKITMPKIDKK